MENDPRRGWWKRNWRWFVPAFFLGLLVLLGVCAVIVWWIVFGALKSSEPYKMALEQVKNDPQVIARLGQPVEDDAWFPSGYVNIEGERGQTQLNFEVAGPNGRARVAIRGNCMEGKWALVELVVTLKDNTRLVLDPVADKDLQEAPPWKPPQ